MDLKPIVDAVHHAITGNGLLYVGDQGVDIERRKFVSIPDTSGRAVYIDGGQAEVCGGANFSLQFIRVCAVAYDADRKRENHKRFEYYALISAIDESGILFKTTVFGADVCVPNIRADDRSLAVGNRSVEIGSVIGEVRKILELEVMKNIASGLPDGAALVRDGDLQQQWKGESPWWDALKEASHRIGVIGICKSGHALTGEGGSANAVLLREGLHGPWYYPHGIVDGRRIGFVKLHKKSKHIFRVDMFTEGYLGTLRKISSDPIFYGYPYGLVVADSFARVSNKEREFLRMKFMHASGAKYKDVEEHMRSLDAHSILDTIG